MSNPIYYPNRDMLASGFPTNWTLLKRLMWVRIMQGGSIPPEYETVTGNPVSFTAKAAPLRKLEVAFSPVQDLHGYDAPWPAGGGKNLANPTYGDKVPSISTGEMVSAYGWSTDFIAVNNTKPYFMSSNLDKATYVLFYDSSKAFLGYVLTSALPNRTYGLANYTNWASVAYVKARCDALSADNVELQLEQNSSSTSYAPYSNECPISGWDSLNVEQRGKNLYPYDTIPIYTYGWYSDYTFDGTPNKIFIKANTDYVLSFDNTENQRINIRAFDASKTLITDNTVFAASQGVYPLHYYSRLHAFSIDGNVSYKYVVIRSSVDAYINIIMGQDCHASTNAQLEIGSTASPYQPYNGRSISITIGQTVYSGVLDVVTGVVKARPHYASYNGETLVGPWMSSMDKYVAGATPTVGAQVVDLGGAETTIQLTPQEVESLAGDNVLFSDANGDLTVEYRSN